MKNCTPSNSVAVKTGCRANLEQTLPQSQRETTVKLPVPVSVQLPAALPVAVLPAQPTTGGGCALASVSVTSAAHPLPVPVMPVSLKQITLLKTQNPTAQQSLIFDSFSEHIDTFLVEVYRCKLCKFHTAVKALMATHMTQKHSLVPGKGMTLNKHHNSRADQVSETTGGDKSGTRLPSAVPSEQQCATLGLSSRSISNCTATTLPSCISVTSSESQGSTVVTDSDGQVRLTSMGKMNSTSSAVANALELLMGIGNESDPDSVKSKERTATGQIHERSDPDLPGSAGSISIPVAGVVGSQSDVSTRDLGPMETVESGQSKARGLLTVNEEELAKTLEIDEKKKESEGESDVGGVEDEDDDESVQQSNKVELSGASVLKPYPIQIGLGSGVSTIDIQEIANTASKSNPKATTITVLHHGQGNEPPTAIQFKKSKKSKAVIPTGESLGIASPFSNRSAYKGNKRFACSSCHARYKSVAELERHVKKKHQRHRKFLCEICGEALATRASVKYHVSKKHAVIQKILRCSFCDYRTQFGARMAIHEATHQSEFFCSLCKKSYVSSERLTKHYSSPLHKNALNPLVCEHCGYSTKKRDNFLVHMRKHTGEKPYKCKLCEYASADGSTLKKHVMAKHSTIRPFKCQQCAFSCVDKKGLDIHARKHTGERPFKCQYCLYAAKRRSALNVHLQTHSKGGQAGKRQKPKPTAGLSTEVCVLQTRSKDGMAGKRHKGKMTTGHLTEVASYETVGQISSITQQNPRPEQQYITMANYEPATLVTAVAQIVPQTAEGEAALQAKPIIGGLDASHDSYVVQLGAQGCVTKPVQAVWQHM